MKIAGTGSVLPKKIVTNDMLSEFLDTSDAWIYPRTGVRSRHVISDEKLEDMAVEAAKKALDDAGLQASELDFIICSNVVNEYITPQLSCIIQGGIGAKCPCLDINCACAGEEGADCVCRGAYQDDELERQTHLRAFRRRSRSSGPDRRRQYQGFQPFGFKRHGQALPVPHSPADSLHNQGGT